MIDLAIDLLVAKVIQENFTRMDADAADAREQQGIAQKGLGNRVITNKPIKEEKLEPAKTPVSTATRVLNDMSDPLYYQPDEFPTQEVRVDRAPRFSSVNRSTVLDILSANRDGLEKQGIIKMPMGMMRKADPTLDIDSLQSRLLDKLNLRPPEGSVQDIQYGAELGKLGRPIDNDRDVDVDRDAPAGKAQDNQPNINDGRGLGSRYKELEPLGEGLGIYATVENVDFDFIKEQEGFKTTVYVPRDEGGKKALENSGVTIASGFDLGKRSEKDLEGLPESIKNKLKPYLGLQRQAAIDYIETPGNKLTISKTEANIINEFAKKQSLDVVVKDWNNTSDVRWEDLSVPQATVVASIAFQFGSKLKKVAPKFWRYTTTGDWAAARDELRDFYSKKKKGLERQRIYGPRRDREADYLEQDNAAILGTKAS